MMGGQKTGETVTKSNRLKDNLSSGWDIKLKILTFYQILYFPSICKIYKLHRMLQLQQLLSFPPEFYLVSSEIQFNFNCNFFSICLKQFFQTDPTVDKVQYIVGFSRLWAYDSWEYISCEF